MPFDASIAYGKKGTELVNNYRALRGLAPVTWSQNLHHIAYAHSLAIAEGRTNFGS